MPDRIMPQQEPLAVDAKADIQGFITTGYGHLPEGAYLSLAFGDPAHARRWLRALIPQVATSVSWRATPDAPKTKPPRALSIAFTYDGLAALGLSVAALGSFPPEFREGVASPERSRILGDTGDSAPEHWELGGPDNAAIHAMLILSAATREDLDAWVSDLREGIRATAGGVIEHEGIAQYGSRLPGDAEHFGFFDGIAQPKFVGIKGEGLYSGEFILGYENQYGFHPVSPVVPDEDDPEGILPASANPYHHADGLRDLGFNGSFVVYRKLEQDVAGFWRTLQEESARLVGKADPKVMVWLAAKMVGRWPSGAPLALAPDADRPGLRIDDFLYAGLDPDGARCPFGSHIRRTNPRDQIGPAGPTQSLHMSERHRIIRRGKSYGLPLFDPAVLTQADNPEALRAILDMQDDGQPRGLHFLCVNANIKSQFEFIQQAWVNNPGFSGLSDNRDPITGDADPDSAPSVMLIPFHDRVLRTASLPRFVTVRGGAYLFMPGLTALRYLAS